MLVWGGRYALGLPGRLTRRGPAEAGNIKAGVESVMGVGALPAVVAEPR